MVKTHVHRVKGEQALVCVVVVVTFVVCGVHLELGESNQHGRLDRGTSLQVIGTLVVVFKHVHSGVVAMNFSIIVRSRRITAYKKTRKELTCQLDMSTLDKAAV